MFCFFCWIFSFFLPFILFAFGFVFNIPCALTIFPPAVTYLRIFVLCTGLENGKTWLQKRISTHSVSSNLSTKKTATERREDSHFRFHISRTFREVNRIHRNEALSSSSVSVKVKKLESSAEATQQSTPVANRQQGTF